MLTRMKSAVVARQGLGVVLNRKQQLKQSRHLPGLWWREAQAVRRLGIVAEARIITVIPTVGKASLLSAVESAVAQQVAGHTVVVVPDGPIDIPPLPTGVVVAHLQRNLGVAGVVRNVGIRSTRSEYLAFLDDDNTWRPGHLESCLTTLSQADVTFSNVNRYRPDGSLFDVIGGPWNRRKSAVSNFVDTNAVVVKRGPAIHFSRISRLGEQFAEDWELVHRLGRTQTVLNTPVGTVNYTMDQALVDRIEAMR